MRPPLRAALPLAAILLLAAASPSLAQGGVAPGLSLDPPSRDVGPGNNTTTELVVRNDGLGPMNVTLTRDASPLNVTLASTRVSVPQGQSVRVRANVSTAGLAPGNYSVTFRAREQLANGIQGATDASATFLVRIVSPSSAPQNGTQNQTSPPPAPPPASSPPPQDGGGQNVSQPAPPPQENATQEPAPPEASNGTGDAPADPPAPDPAPEPVPPAPPVVAPARLTLGAQPGARVPFQVEVANPNDAAQTYDALLRLPLGWAGGLERSRLDVPAHGRVLLDGSVQALAGAEDAEATLTLQGPGGEAVARLSLLALPAPEEPPATSLTDPEPDRIVASDAPAPPPAGRVTLRIEPAEVRVAPGQRALARVVLENGLDAPLAAQPRLVLPEWVRLEGEVPGATVPPGEVAHFPLVLRADEDAPVGSMRDATVEIDAAVATFRILVVEPAASDQTSPTPAAASEDAPWLAALVATAAGGVALACAWAWRKWQVPLLALYARLRADRVLDHPARAAIRDLVHAEPGVQLAQVQRRTGLANGTLRHHVRRLEAAGLLRVVRDGPHRRLWPSAAGRVEPAPGLAERALRVLQESGPMPAPALAARLGVSRQALHYHVKRLAAQGRLDARTVGRDRVLAARAPAPELQPGRASP